MTAAPEHELDQRLGGKDKTKSDLAGGNGAAGGGDVVDQDQIDFAFHAAQLAGGYCQCAHMLIA